MDQYLSIYNIRQKLHKIIKATDPDTARALQDIDVPLADFHDHGCRF